MMTESMMLEFDLSAWCERCPSGVILYEFSSNGAREAVDSEYCDSIADFKAFIDRHADNFDKLSTKVTFDIDVNDVDTSNVLDVVCEISQYANAVLCHS